MFKRIAAIFGIFACTCVAWMILGTSIFYRTDNLGPVLSSRFGSIMMWAPQVCGRAQRFRALGERAMLVRRSGLMKAGVAFHYGRLYLWTVAALILKRVLPEKLKSVILRHRPIKGMG